MFGCLFVFEGSTPGTEHLACMKIAPLPFLYESDMNRLAVAGQIKKSGDFSPLIQDPTSFSGAHNNDYCDVYGWRVRWPVYL